jgi:hypothetical protein
MANTTISMIPAIKNEGHKINIKCLRIMADHLQHLSLALPHGYAFALQEPFVKHFALLWLFALPKFY